MKKLMNLKFKKNIQIKLNEILNDNEDIHDYTLGEVLKISAGTIILMALFIAISFIG